MKRWKGFERLAEQIYSELSPDATVTWNDQIYGHDSGTNRQIDVSIRWCDSGHDYLLLVQARDRSARADVNSVGEFASVVRDVRAHGGILVCRSGFTKAAKTMARNLGLALHGLHDAQSKDWRHELAIPILWVDLIPRVEVKLLAHFNAGDQLAQDDDFAILSSDEGRTRLKIVDTFQSRWNAGELDRSTGTMHTVHHNVPVGVLVTDASGQPQWRPVADFRLEYVVDRRAWLGRFTPSDCRGLIDSLDENAFVASYLPIGEIPTVRGDGWRAIGNPDDVAVTLRGSFVTTEGYQIHQPKMGERHLELVEADPSA